MKGVFGDEMWLGVHILSYNWQKVEGSLFKSDISFKKFSFSGFPSSDGI